MDDAEQRPNDGWVGSMQLIGMLGHVLDRDHSSVGILSGDLTKMVTGSNRVGLWTEDRFQCRFDAHEEFLQDESSASEH